MLFLKRALTSFALFILLSIVLSIGAMAVIGGVVGARAAANDPKARDFDSGYSAGHAAGYEVGRKYGPIVLLSTVGVSALASVLISFSGSLPWCRKQPEPPALPRL